MSIVCKYDLFKNYYLHNLKPEDLILPEIKFHHFRFQLFDRKVRFERLRDILKSQEQLYNVLVRYVPQNAYFTPVKWLNPIYVRKTREALDIMLSSPLFFDIDMKHLSDCTFEGVRKNTQKLIDFVNAEFGLSPDLVVFSGRQGFHVYYWKYDEQELVKKSPQERIKEFRKKRMAILRQIRGAGIVVDEQITADPYRIMRIPNTLHGSTGFIAKPIEDIETFTLESVMIFESRIYEEFFGSNISILEVNTSKLDHE